MEFLPWKKMTTIKYVKMPKIAVKTPPISIKRLKLAHKRLKLAPTGENSTVISRIFHACIMVVHFFFQIILTHRSAPRAPADHPDQLVLLCRCLLYGEGSSAVALPIIMIQHTQL